DQGHQMRLADASDSAPALDPSSLSFVHDGELHGEAVRVFDWRARARASVSKVTLNDYDMLRPSLDLSARAKAKDAIDREWYQYPGRYSVPAEGQRLAKTRLEELRSGRLTASAQTNALAAQPGKAFSLQGHPFGDAKYLITGIALLLRSDREDSSGPLVDRGDAAFRLQMEVVPSGQPFRPPRCTPRPRILGMQTARVTGPSGEEIHCDEHGRVKLQFHWDRDGKLDDKSSCWVRVSQAHTTGSVMIPRIGWEVGVEFLDGDPDRPLCMGRLYNDL